MSMEVLWDWVTHSPPQGLEYWLAWISTSPYYPKTGAGFALHAVKTSFISFHQGTVTGLFSNPEASTIGR